MRKISVVVPIYNVEQYIANSMLSLCNQTYKDFEVILVDNNSKDNSVSIAVNILSLNNIENKVVKEKKQGLPAARNCGIRNANCEWIISIDPDDTISPDFLTTLLNAANEYSVMLVFSQFREVTISNVNTFFLYENSHSKTKFLSRDELMKSFLIRKLSLMVSNMFFHKSLIEENNVWFDEDVMLGSDLIFIWKLLMLQPNVVYIHVPLYNHLCRTNSLMTAPSIIKIQSNIDGYKRLKKHMNSNYDTTFANWVLHREIFALLSTASMFDSLDNFKQVHNSIYTIKTFYTLQSFPDLRVRILNLMLRYCNSVFYLLTRYLRAPKVNSV